VQGQEQEHVQAIVSLRSGRQVDNQVVLPKENPVAQQEQGSSITKEKDVEPSTTTVEIPPRSFTPKASYPDRLLAPKKGRKFEDILEVFNQLQINIQFLDAIQQVTSYAKFLKDLITVKRKTIVPKKDCLTEHVSSILQCKLPIKHKDLGCPTIYVLIKVDKLYFPVDFLVLDTEPVQNVGIQILVILGRPFLATANTLINCRTEAMKISFGNMIVEMNIFDISKQPLETTEIGSACLIEEIIEDTIDEVSIKDPLEACFPQFGEDLDLVKLLEQADAMLELASLENSKENEVEVFEPSKKERKPLPNSLKYKFLCPTKSLLVIIALDLVDTQEEKLLDVLREYKKAIGWTIEDIQGISPLVVMHKLHLEEDSKPSREPQRRLNPAMQEVFRAEVIKLLDACIIYPISDSKWVSPIHVVPKQAGLTVVENKDGELVPTRIQSRWKMCIDNRKLNAATRKDHFPLPFIDQMVERLAGHAYYCFLDGYSGYNQVSVDPEDQEKTTFTCPFGTFAYRRMPFGLCNALTTFQWCMVSIFSDMVEHFLEIFMDDFSVYG
jgi:hypothetical protein